MAYADARGFSNGKHTEFWIIRDSTIVPTHAVVEPKGRAQMKAFHKAAPAAGAKYNVGPGYRNYWPGCSAAFVHDRDGHHIDAAWYAYSEIQ